MKSKLRVIRWMFGILLLFAAITMQISAQDTHYGPNGQQIPPPGCLT